MNFEYFAKQGDGSVIVAFHGTGGNQKQMLPLVEAVDPTAAYLSPLGQVMESGVNPRYFRRFEEGVLDVPDLKLRAGHLVDWLPGALAAEGMDRRPRTAFGYSNGASISAGILLLYPEVFDRVILLRPMVPFEPEVMPDLSGKKVLICASESDTITPFQGARGLEALLKSAGAEVTLEVVPGGHSLGMPDIKAAQSFLAVH